MKIKRQHIQICRIPLKQYFFKKLKHQMSMYIRKKSQIDYLNFNLKKLKEQLIPQNTRNKDQRRKHEKENIKVIKSVTLMLLL